MSRCKAFLFLVLAVGWCALAQAPGTDLEHNFQNPPAAAKPRVWWHWMNGNVTKEGIRLDLEWMKRVGIGGLQNFDASLATPQVVPKRLPYMTPEWKDAFRYAAELADQSGLEMAIASSPGWSETGGPWVKPEQGMKKLVWSELRVAGGTPFKGTLPKPPSITGPFQSVPFKEELPLPGAKPVTPPQFYSDAVVVAYKLPANTSGAGEPATVTSSAGVIDPKVLDDGDYNNGVKIPVAAEGGWLRYEYKTPRTISAVTIARPATAMFSAAPPLVFHLECSEDGQTFRQIADLPPTHVPQETVSFAPVTARFFQLKIGSAPPPAEIMGGFEPAPGVDLGVFSAFMKPGAPVAEINEFVLHTTPRINRFEEKAGFGLVPDYYAVASPSIDEKQAVRPAEVVDLTRQMKADGSLEWTPPQGEWVILRLGYSLTGTTNHPATAEATGLEVDKLDRDAVKSYIDTYLGTYADTVGPQLMGRHGVRALLTDSIEVGAYNWTPALLQEFKRLRGYDATPYLPALTGIVVGSAEQSDKFLWDFRRTLAQLTAESHYGQIAKSAHEHGLTYYGESLEGTRVSIGDDLEMRQHADIPMAAMWTYTPKRGPRSNYVIDIRGAASVAHVYGQNLVAAESMTSALVPWGFSPRILKPIIDEEFALGVNRPVIHTSVHQPLVDKKPGLSLMIFGQYFNRNETWAEQAKPWVTYISRNAYLLQQGKFVADVAYFYGEEAPLAGLYGEGRLLPQDLPVGYGFDFVNSDAVLNQFSVANGCLETRSGMRYRALYLGGSSSRMTVAVLRKLREFVNAGAVIVGDRPVGSPSLADNANEFSKIADELWSGNTGAGKVIPGKDVNAALRSLGVERDFDYEDSGGQKHTAFIHRHLSDGDLYFVLNKTDQPLALSSSFRISGKAPELWHADTGAREAASYRIEGGRTNVPLLLAPNESVFVVFRRATATKARKVPVAEETTLASVEGPWEIHFAPNLGAPEKISLDHLASWSENSDAGVKYFSGTAAYVKQIDASSDWLKKGQRVVLDLGDVRELAEVSVNGRSLGIVWHPPYRIDISDALKRGNNVVEIKVTNLWVNRLIGDQQPGATKYTFTAMPTYRADAPLRPSGLLGPVTLRTEKTVADQ
ncbi:MAG TPA: glycosyl hydrolase [Bryobacteraceae bacterium]|jgi:hypothetical protein|nr:glycosyl hydrolase [Bryobacteraceae bacterium]